LHNFVIAKKEGVGHFGEVSYSTGGDSPAGDDSDCQFSPPRRRRRRRRSRRKIKTCQTIFDTFY
jgi:hypothetical protein